MVQTPFHLLEWIRNFLSCLICYNIHIVQRNRFTKKLPNASNIFTVYNRIYSEHHDSFHHPIVILKLIYHLLLLVDPNILHYIASSFLTFVFLVKIPSDPISLLWWYDALFATILIMFFPRYFCWKTRTRRSSTPLWTYHCLSCYHDSPLNDSGLSTILHMIKNRIFIWMAYILDPFQIIYWLCSDVIAWKIINLLPFPLLL